MIEAPRSRGADPFDYAETIVRCAQGDRAALRQLYERDAGALLGVATSIQQRPELADDAGRAGLFAILRNRALNILRDGAREESTDADLLAGEPDDRPDPEAVVALLDETQRLRVCLEALEPRRREGLVLAYTHGLSHGEVAARLRVPLGTAKSWIRRAFLEVRECMR